MAGDWIKFECCTLDKPEVFHLSVILDLSPDDIIGKLLRLWVWADQQVSPLCHPCVTSLSLIDHVTKCTNFGKALLDENVKWLEQKEGRIYFVNFDRHNGKSSKKRAINARNKRKSRQDVTDLSPPEGDILVTKEGLEKRREENIDKEKNIKKENEKITKKLFKTFWKAYPEDLRGGKITTSWNAWKRNSADYPKLYNDESLIKATEWVEKSTAWRESKYVEGITKFITQALWKRSIKNGRNETSQSNSAFSKIEQAERAKNEQADGDNSIIEGHCDTVENHVPVLRDEVD